VAATVAAQYLHS